ncbi:zinc finger protein 64 homolog, isoforms 1 and 2-like isoform X2 [Acanthaster planci]|nr:zinc finger protein 64 homolog, isoforms 1 and 2-like isoform X2 [Acanthaster planci]
MASQEVQLRCKLCQFTASSKQEIADHFMDVHAAVEIIGTSSPNPSGPTPETGSTCANLNNEAGDAADPSTSDALPSAGMEVGTADRALSKKKVGFRGNALRSTISHLVRAAEQASKEERSANSAKTPKSVRRHQQASAVKEISQTVHAVGRELRKHKMKRKFEDFVLLDNDQPQRKQPKVSPTKGTAGKPGPAGAKAGGDKQTASRKSRRTKQTQVVKGSKVKATELKKKMDDELQQWYEKWSQNRKSIMETCKNANCNSQLPPVEMKLHEQCHMKNYTGFKCPHCNHMHSQWRNMRCHIYNDHQEIAKPLLLCDWPGCSAPFTILWGLKRHVLRDHIQPKAIQENVSEQDESLVEVGEAEEQSRKDKASEESLPSEEADLVAKRAAIRKKLSKGMEEYVDAGTTEEEAVKKIRNRKKFHKIAWLPSCSVCEAKYISIENMDAHIALHTVEGSDSVKCAECGIIVDDCTKLRAHMKEKHRRLLKVYRCELCKYAGDRHYDYKKHLLTHEDTKPCMCEVCGKLMSTVYNLKVHILRVHATEEQKTVHCQHCDYRCADKIVLKDHMRFQHNLLWNGDPYKDVDTWRSYKCDKCDYVGRKEKSLKYHMRVHTEHRQFRCSMCCYASGTKNNLILHMRTHAGLKPVKCSECDYRGATNKVVNEHIMSKHRGIRPFKCPCGWSTAYSGNMWKHMQFHREKGDAYKDIAEARYGKPGPKKKKQVQHSEAPIIQQPQIITIVHEFQDAQDAGTLNSGSHQPSATVVPFQESTLAAKDVPASSAVAHVEDLPILGTHLLLNSLVQAATAVAPSGTKAGSDDDPATAGLQQAPEELQDHKENQAASYLCKLAHAVSTQSTGQEQESPKQMAEGKELPLGSGVQVTEVQVPTANAGSVEQTIQELVLW